MLINMRYLLEFVQLLRICPSNRDDSLCLQRERDTTFVANNGPNLAIMGPRQVELFSAFFN